MWASKASKGQKRRRRREAKEQNNQVKAKPVKKLNPKSKPIVILSDTEENEIEFIHQTTSDNESEAEVLNTETGNAMELDPVIDDDLLRFEVSNIEPNPVTSENLAGETVEIEDFQEVEMDERNQANDMVQYMLASINDETSDEETFSIEDEPLLEGVWPVFSYNQSTKPMIQKRILKSGKTQYKQPVENPNSSSQKLVPAPILRQTKHEWKKRAVKAVGSNTDMMKNYFVRLEPIQQSVASPVIDPSLETATLNNNNQQYDQVPQETVQLRLQHVLKNYLSSPKCTSPISKSQKAQTQWNELKSALAVTISCYKEKEKKDIKIKIPQSMIDNVTQFNNL